MEKKKCRNDISYWLDTYGFTYDPREAEPVLPFKLFPRQREFLEWLNTREKNEEDGLAEKCRDVGFTWLCAAFAAHRWLFRRGYAVGFGSRKLILVDELGNLDSILEKIRFLIEHQPYWMQPPGLVRKRHLGYCKLLNPSTGSTITGEGGDNIGRGGRKSIYFVDEHAFLARAKQIEAALSQTSRCKIRVSTPNGMGNAFHTLRFGGKIPVFTFRWRDDPRKDDAWYKRQCEILDPVTVAQEIDIDYSASIEGICIPAKWVMAAVNLFSTARFRSVYPGYTAPDDVIVGFDIAEEGKNKSVLVPGRGPVILEPIAWGQLNTTQTAWRARDEMIKLGARVVNYDCIGVGAGVKGTWQSSEKELPFRANAVRAGDTPSETRWPDGKLSNERFVNLKAEIWWIARTRFERAYEFLELGIDHPPEHMVSIPLCEQLISDLSIPLYFATETGKIQIEGKKDLMKRGIASPDYADAFVLRYVPGLMHVGVWKEAESERERVEAEGGAHAEQTYETDRKYGAGDEPSAFDGW